MWAKFPDVIRTNKAHNNETQHLLPAGLCRSPSSCYFFSPALHGGLDYCNSLLAGIPQKLINKVQCVMNCAARLVCKVPKQEHVTPLPPLVDLHWLPVERILEYKIGTICYSVITGTAPPYLSDLLELYTPSRTLRSSADTRVFRIPNSRKRFQGQRAFSFIGPSFWNNSPFSVRHAQTLSAFTSQLKTYLFSFSYSYILI